MSNVPAPPSPRNWKNVAAVWGAPAIVLGILVLVVSTGNGWLSSRFTTVEDRTTRLEKGVQDLTSRLDQRFDQSTQRLDKLIDAQKDLAIQIARTDGSVSSLIAKVDRISQKLHVASNENDVIAAAPTLENAIAVFKESGVKVVDFADLDALLSEKPKLTQEIGGGPWYAFTVDKVEQKKFMDLLPTKK